MSINVLLTGGPVFLDMPRVVADRMAFLERADAADREDNTPRSHRLRQVTPDTGRFLALMAASAPMGSFIEIGTSAGYSAMWIALACRTVSAHLTTFEVMREKVDLAAETISSADLADVVRLVHGDFRDSADRFQEIAFCFLDADKDVYAPCYEVVVERLVSGGLLIADNATSHASELRPFLERVMADGRVDAMVATIGRGQLVCRRRRPVAGRPHRADGES